ncbi:kinesin light chain 3 [Verticillium dahliae]|nr:kinesin light chain 3 [Verticillium dahliae]
MEVLGAAASLGAVIDLSAKVATLCVQYAEAVANAREDIRRLQNQVSQLGVVLQHAKEKRLAEGPRAELLVVSRKLTSTIAECTGDLRELEKKLSPNPARRFMRRVGFRALKWPFMSQEVNRILSSLERYEKTVLLGLQLDQTYGPRCLTLLHMTETDCSIRTMISEIHEGVRNLASQATEDVSISRKPHHVLPFTLNPDYIHRSALWDWIRHQYTQPARRMALLGMGGFGIFWINVMALVRDCLQSSDVSAWFMVVDNADDVSVFFAKDDQDQEPLASYLPKTAKGKILITSRSLDAAEKLTGGDSTILRIPYMEEEQALHLLRKKLHQEVDEATASNLMRALNYIPLAVNQAAAYINRRSPLETPESYLDKFRRSEKQRDGLLRIDGGDLGRPDDASNSIVLTWQVTLEQIRREKPRAANLLSLMSCFQAQNIPENMLHGYEDIASEGEVGSKGSGKRLDTYTDTDANTDEVDTRGNFENDIDVLRGYSLIAPTAPGLYEMHSLVQFCTRLWISEFGDRRRWAKLFIQVAAEHFPDGGYEKFRECQRLLPHVEAVVESKPKLEGDLPAWSRLLTKVSDYMIDIGDFARAEEMLKKAIQVLEDALEAGHPSTLESQAMLSKSFRFQRRYDEAERLDLKVLKTQKAKLGIDHPATLASMYALAVTFFGQDRYEEAGKLQQEVLEAHKAKLAPDHPAMLASMHDLAVTIYRQSRYEEAGKLQQEVLEAHKAKLAPDHPAMLASMHDLAVTIYRQSRYEEAGKLQQEVLEAHKAKLAPDHPAMLASMHDLAVTIYRQSRYEEAGKLQQEVLEAHKAKLAPDHPVTLASMHDLAVTWRKIGRHQDALILLQDYVSLQQKKFGPTHPDTQGLELNP